MQRIVLLLILASSLLFGGSLYDELIKEQIRSIPKDKAIVVGKGNRELITVINPDCPHCRAEWKELRKHLNELRIYIFLFPFKTWGEENFRKAYYIACSENKLKALDEVMLGKLDGRVPNVGKCSLVEEHLKVVEKLGVNGVPYNIIPQKNKIIEGFSKDLIKELGIEK